MIATLVAETKDATPIDDSSPEAVIIDLLSHVRAKFGRAALNIDVHLWIRELTRLGRAATGSPEFIWDDDGVRLTDLDGAPATYLPAVYCRHCNRSGWAVTLGPTGWELDSDDTTIRRRKQRNDDRFRALVHAPAEAAAYDPAQEPDPHAASRLAWLIVPERRISLKLPAEKDLEEGNALPVLVHTGDSAGTDSVNDTCPSCRQADGIRFLGLGHLHDAVGVAVHDVRHPGTGQPRETRPGVHRQRAGRRAPRRVHPVPFARTDLAHVGSPGPGGR